MNKIFVLAVFIASLLTSFIVFGNTLKGEFVYDDTYFTQNTNLKSASYIKTIFTSPYNVAGSGNYRPMSSLSYLANFIITGESPFGFHLFNIILHGTNIFLIIVLTYGLFGDKKLAIIVALLFAVFPIHSENVANIKGREEVLSAFFVLLSWIIFNSAVKYADKINYFKILLSSFVFLLATLAKELSILNIGVIICYFYWSGKRKVSDLLKISICYAIAIGIHLLLRYQALGEFAFKFNSPYFINNPLYFDNFLTRLASSLKIIYIYVTRTILPTNLSATYHFAHFQSFRGIADLPQVLIGGLIILLALYFLFSKKNRGKPLFIGSLILLIPYLLISQIFFPQGDVLAERFFYFPSLSMSVIMGYFLNRLLKHNLIICFSVLAILVTFYSATAIFRNKVWQTNRTLFESMVKDAPESIQGHYGLALEELKSGNIILASEHAEKAYSINQAYPPAVNVLAASRFSEGKLQEAEDLYLKSISLEPGFPQALQGLSAVYYSEGKYEESMKAIEKVSELTGEVKIESVVTYAASLAKLKKYEQSLRFITRFPPEFQEIPALRFILAVNYYKLGRTSEAIKYFDWDLKISHDEKIKRIISY